MRRAPSLSPAFLPGMTRTKSAVAREKIEEEEWLSGAHDHVKVGGDLDDDDDDDDDEGLQPGRRGSSERRRSGGLLRGARRALGMTTPATLGPLESVKGFGTAFNKERKQRGKTLRRAGVFGLDKPLVLQNGKRIGDMRWYTKQRVYGDLVVVHDNSYSRITQEASALLKQAGSIMSLATAGRAAKATGVGDFLSSKVEAACDTGKRRAVNMVESVLAETKQKLLDDLTKDRDMPGNVRKVFQAVVGVYFSEVQQEVMDEVARRLKTLSYSHNKKKGKAPAKRSAIHAVADWHGVVVGVPVVQVRQETPPGFPRVGAVQRTAVRQDVLGEAQVAGVVVAPAHQALLRVGHPGVPVRHETGDARSDGRVAALRVHLQLQGNPVPVRRPRHVPGDADVHGVRGPGVQGPAARATPTDPAWTPKPYAAPA